MVTVSIILPVFNSSQTIDECLESVLKQTLNDLEIVCVDDHSTDDSVEKIKTWALKDTRIKTIFHDTNLGTLKTRYDGVMNSTGKYIMFIDSDDLYEKDACSKLSKIMKSSDIDMLQFGTNIVTNDMNKAKVKGYEYFLKPYCKDLFGDDILIAQMTKFSWHVWNRIYTRELCEKAYKAAGEDFQIYSDDIHVSFYLSYFAKHFKGISERYYNYRIDKGFTGTTDNLKLLRIICDNSWYIHKCLEFLKNENKYDSLSRYCIRHPLSEYDHSIRVWRSLKDKNEIDLGHAILNDTWNDMFYGSLLKREMSKRYGFLRHTYDRLKYSIELNGLMNTLKISFWHIYSSITKK